MSVDFVGCGVTGGRLNVVPFRGEWSWLSRSRLRERVFAPFSHEAVLEYRKCTILPNEDRPALDFAPVRTELDFFCAESDGRIPAGGAHKG